MRVAVLQFSPILGVVGANLERILGAVDEAARAGADLFVAPEMSLTGWTLPDPKLRKELATAVAVSAIPALQRAAVSRRLALVVGGPELGRDTAQDAPEACAANAAFAISADGIQTVYRKMHLFEDERRWWVTGEGAAVALFGAVRVGITICYDAEFPEIPRVTRLMGAQILVVPTTNMTPYERDQEVVFATRALENEFPVIVANRVGTENGWTYFGRSVVLDERGRALAEAGTGEELLIADVDVAVRGNPALSYIRRRRPEVYGRLVEPNSPQGESSSDYRHH